MACDEYDRPGHSGIEFFMGSGFACLMESLYKWLESRREKKQKTN
nr:hypothetical protein [Candidatus Sigynarchaeota archaeon]